MRLVTTIDRLDADQWELAQKILRTEYDISADTVRACVTVEHRGEERHVEMPLANLIGLLAALRVDSLMAPLRVAMAALTLDALPDHPDSVRNEADPVRAAAESAGMPDLVRLPTPEQVRNLTASDAVKLAAEMNQPKPKLSRDEIDILDGIPESRSTELPDGV